MDFVGFYGSFASLLMWVITIVLFMTLYFAISLCCFKDDGDEDDSPNRYQ